jgi:hypothetical protein
MEKPDHKSAVWRRVLGNSWAEGGTFAATCDKRAQVAAPATPKAEQMPAIFSIAG